MSSEVEILRELVFISHYKLRIMIRFEVESKISNTETSTFNHLS